VLLFARSVTKLKADSAMNHLGFSLLVDR